MNRMIEAMLFLARADSAKLALRLKRFDLADEARSVAEFYEPLAGSRGLLLEVHGDSLTFADRMLVRCALANLVSMPCITPPLAR